MQINRITAPDYNLVTKLFNDYRVFYEQPSDIILAEKFIKERLENNESVIFMAVATDALSAGFTQLYPLISSVRAIRNWVLNDLFVAPEYRKQGIGEMLIKAAIDFATANGAAFLQLETAIDNHPAQRLYDNMGFKIHESATSFITYRLPLKQ
jgi:ribosomal protein S18 acetylase RimI-like enzyme